jgi:hypothetical protein
MHLPRLYRKRQRRFRRAVAPNASRKRHAACDHLVTVPQTPNANTCWFNAILMVLFFSDAMRTVVKKALETSSHRLAPNVLDQFSTLLLLYKQPIESHRRIYDKAFPGIRPEDILKTIVRAHPAAFIDLPEEAVLGTQGANHAVHFKNMLQLLGIRANSYAVRDGMLYQTNELPFVPRADVACIFVHEFGMASRVAPLHPWVFRTSFRVGDDTYVLDATLMGSNNGQLWHAIAGVTCNGKRFYYNGWQQQNVPCPLIPVDFARRGIYLDPKNKRCYATERRSPADLYYNGADPQQVQCLVYVRSRAGRRTGRLQ